MDKGSVIITLRKEVQTEVEAKIILETVKQKLSDHPDVTVTGHFTNHYDVVPDEPI